MKRMTFCFFLLTLALVVISLSQSRPKKSTQVSSQTISSIRKIDFKNFSYPANQFSPKCQIRNRNVKIVDGEGTDRGKCGFYGVSVSGYGDITGDNNEEVLVNLSCSCGIVGTNREEAYSREIIYTVENGQAKILGVFQPSVTDYNNAYKSYYKDGNELMSADYYPTIENRLLTVKIKVGTGDIRFDQPKFGVRLKYRWNGSAFVLTGKPERWKCASYDCEQ